MKFMVTSVASRLRVVKKLLLGKNCRRSNGKTVDFEYYIGTIYQRRLTGCTLIDKGKLTNQIVTSPEEDYIVRQTKNLTFIFT